MTMIIGRITTLNSSVPPEDECVDEISLSVYEWSPVDVIIAPDWSQVDE